uniref:EF-hand calcium binding domain 14 n=1 Tax=Chelonoidis abingdonii TaxID=106734 RepID=A0A8C0GXX6_CHEAB
MKKRKELNAAHRPGGDGRRKKLPKKGSGHRLLRTEPPASDSESSSREKKFLHPSLGEYLRCCKFCYPLCAFVILAACVVACVGLVWMQVALKEDLDALKEKFRSMESYQKTSFQEIPKLNEDLLDQQKHLEKIETGDMGLNKIWINITEINKQILFLTSAVNHLKVNIKSASDLITLPVTVEELQKSVATIGSTLTSVAHDVDAMQVTIEEHKKTTERLQNDLVRTVPSISNKNQTENCKQDNQFLHATVEEINASLVVYQKLNDLKLLSVDTAISNITQRVAWLESSVVTVNTLENRANLSTSAVKNVDPQVSKLREKLQLINALTSNACCLKLFVLLADLQDLFEKTDQGIGGKLSYEDLQTLVGLAIQEPQSFKEFDTDGDEKYSLPELRLALGV